MNPEQKLKLLIGDLVFQNTILSNRVEILEKQIKDLEENKNG